MTLLLLLTGAGTTSAPVVYTGLAAFGVDSRRRIEALDVPGKTLSGMSVRRRIEALDVRTREGVTASLPTDVKRKIDTLRVDRSG